jgi:hypothetical protein
MDLHITGSLRLTEERQVKEVTRFSSDFLKSPKSTFSVIPAKAGIQYFSSL